MADGAAKSIEISQIPINGLIWRDPIVARTGRHQQRYDQGHRLVAGCIPYKYTFHQSPDGSAKKTLEVLMISSHSGRGLLFPKGGWETDETVEEAACREALEEAGVRGLLQANLGCWDFKSKRQLAYWSPEGLCRAHVFALSVTEQLDSWPEQQSRQREWFTVEEAREQCQQDWMRLALEKCVLLLSSTPQSDNDALE